jgi:hypothetical protein
MSRSPRRLLRRAADALTELEQVLVAHPGARHELDAELGGDLARSVAECTAILVRAAERLEAVDGADSSSRLQS